MALFVISALAHVVRSVALKNFARFDDATEAVAAAAAVTDGKLGKSMKKLLKKVGDKESLAVADPKLGAVIKEKLSINCIYDSSVNELLRGIRLQAESLVKGGDQLKSMRLGLAHGLSRYKLKFSPDKVDTMIVQAIGAAATGQPPPRLERSRPSFPGQACWTTWTRSSTRTP